MSCVVDWQYDSDREQHDDQKKDYDVALQRQVKASIRTTAILNVTVSVGNTWRQSLEPALSEESNRTIRIHTCITEV